MKFLVPAAALLTCAGVAGYMSHKGKKAKIDEKIDTASDDSFPASDPPAWTASKSL